MSMSQEEIEALMNGLDGPATPSESSDPVVEEEVAVEELNVEATETPEAEVEVEAEVEEVAATEEDDISELLETIDTVNSENIEDIAPAEEEVASVDVKDDIADVLSEIDNMDGADLDLTDIDDILLDEDDNSTALSVEELNNDPEFTEKALSWTEDKITKGEFPFPAEPSTKVVSQLNEVAQDNEEKAGQIFDVLSYIVDDNAVLQKSNKKLDAFITSQIELLNTLSTKFPNIAVFSEHLANANETKEVVTDISQRLSDEDMKLFEAMEIMQFHDINRQKIERVMSVIRKLTAYLNNLFEEDGEYEEIAVAKHIHGDSTADLVEEGDLDALIAEFNN